MMTGLLQRDPSKRLGANGGEEIKKHPFFAKYIDWNRYEQGPSVCVRDVDNFTRLLAKRYPPPFKPSVVSSDTWLLHVSLLTSL